MRIFQLNEIKRVIDFSSDIDELINSQKTAFIDFSSGIYEVPNPMQFIFPDYSSDCHVKGGYKQGSKNLVIKIANGGSFGISGVILIFAADTGELKMILHDEGFLTTLRTAIAGLIVSEIIPWHPQNIGIVGTGNLSAMLYKLTSIKYPNSNIMLYARDKNKAKNITDVICQSVEEFIIKCDVIFTATSSIYPIICNILKDSNKTLIALGSDDEYKSELSQDLFTQCDLVIVDRKSQAQKFGDVAKALKSGVIASNAIIELGDILKSGISLKTKVIIADFSGIGAQDVAISEFVLSRMLF